MKPASAPTKKLAAEARRLSKMLAGKRVARIWRHRPHEVGIEFDDGARLFLNFQPGGVEASVTGIQ